ncbi:MAG: hypothetical protein IJZ29_02475 [Clostridia bacterium]|nr:hypothetical protein [Clostridia bacterium]
MKILVDGTINIDTREELASVYKYVAENKIDKIKLKIGSSESFKIEEIKQENVLSDYSEFYAKYSGLLDKVESLNFFDSMLDYSLIKNCRNLKSVSAPRSCLVNSFVKALNEMKHLKELESPFLSILNKKLPDTIEKIVVTAKTNKKSYAIDDESKLVAITDDLLKNVSNLKEISLINIAQCYHFGTSSAKIEKCSLIGNYNLTRINLPQNLGNIKELKIYGNNPDCNFDAWRVAEIIRATFKGENKLNKFVFDIALYPRVVKILENDLKNPKFKAVFDNLVFTGEMLDHTYNELNAKQMENYDKKALAVIKGCGVRTTDTDFEAFAKLYLFVVSNLSYNHKTFEVGQRDKIGIIAKEIAGSFNSVDKYAMLGKGYNTSTTFGAFNTEFLVVCAGFSRFLSYLLNKVGIDSQVFSVFAGNIDSVNDSKQKAWDKKNTNHMVLRVDFETGSLMVDPTADAKKMAKNKSLHKFSFATGDFDEKYDDFLKGKFYRQEKQKLCDDAVIELLAVLIQEKANMLNGNAYKMPLEIKYSTKLGNCNLPDGFENEYDYISLDKKSYFERDKDI